MCGIAGVFGRFDEEAVRRMTEAMPHRGPDHRAIWGDSAIPATLGHCRLSIVDLSAAGHQPMSCRQGRFWIVFNGEIFNFQELAAELRAAGHAFRSHTDTEVILAAYAEWGVHCLPRLRGMFAFALLDRNPPGGKPALLLARDRLGIKPLLYERRGPDLWFSSELRGLRAATGRHALDPDAFHDYCIFGSILQPRTMLAGVQSLPPGHYLQAFTDGSSRTACYWELDERTRALRSGLRTIREEEAVERLQHLLVRATRYQMMGDVPVGAFLSGGLDSATVVAFMQREQTAPIKTFSIGFSAQRMVADERAEARETARLLGTDHHELVVDSKDIAADFDRLVDDLDQPSIDGGNTWLVARFAAREVKVAISGLGGDELFAGYRHFALLTEADQGAPGGQPACYRFWHRLRRTLRAGPFSYRQMIRAAPRPIRRALVRRIIQNYEIAHMFQPDVQARVFRRVEDAYRGWDLEDADSIQRTSFAELKGYLLNTLLRDSDITSMAHSLELRPVLLDHELVEYAFALPGHLKLKGDIRKHILIRAASSHLPPEVLNRPKKGFELPQILWMTTALKDRILGLLEGNMARSLFTRTYLLDTARALKAGKARPELWAWTILLQWLESSGTYVP